MSSVIRESNYRNEKRIYQFPQRKLNVRVFKWQNVDKSSTSIHSRHSRIKFNELMDKIWCVKWLRTYFQKSNWCTFNDITISIPEFFFFPQSIAYNDQLYSVILDFNWMINKKDRMRTCIDEIETKSQYTFLSDHSLFRMKKWLVLPDFIAISLSSSLLRT